MILFWLILMFVNKSFGAEENPTNDSNGFGYELLLAKMDFLEYKLLEMEVDVKEEIESVLLKQEKSERAVLEQTSDILAQQKVFANHESIKQSIFDLQPKKRPSDNTILKDFLLKNRLLVSPSQALEQVQKRKTIQSCESASSQKSGKYWISQANSTDFQVYCEQTLYGGGWIVIQNRFDGLVDFYRNWTEYKNGFGDLDGEFWLGLDKIHALTSTKSMKLLVHLENFNGVQKHVVFPEFGIGNEGDGYILNKISGTNEILEQSMLDQKGWKFSTFDVDNDEDSTYNCARERQGAWWYKYCSFSNLNGPYKNEIDKVAMHWYHFSEKYEGLKISKMMIK